MSYKWNLFMKHIITQNLIKQQTCYKSPDNSTCMNLILTYVPLKFQSTCVIETGLSDFYWTTLTFMRKTFKTHSQKSATFDRLCSTEIFMFRKTDLIALQILIKYKVRENANMYYRNFKVFMNGCRLQFLLKLGCNLRYSNKTLVSSHFITLYLNIYLF